ncbi:type II toxin-antitoxin system VapB family antitoxin [Actinobacillus pleuropneumoniae]|uniref:Type II toxin-antitoxin system VapB family antitoxin n=1 Tax=Actinobacillus pleuropneumoniae TaxID=715 RepID=A0A9Q4DIX7_ACTPL|nr:type II toxin-antitoxin system VapB family antitoxin [Actinobacillus pleuropneumoniae]MCL7721144.1 antitoxin [Actinobacillus pleuropneumoniae]MCL7727164.1 antitoxin [Actinobacillus pleuropneumoniae]MCL7730271.1 antitoxin [Actinobacillus pleuropneumoniae]MCY6368665.1 type II toxin-antitoxin system VapB family antitoxin [Actinobacillus pleuropneumoniae]MCY6385536.1 type II toxin-antitoxin system VapB family antitoxin [Actinobacillus pleuropneumoniae]
MEASVFMTNRSQAVRLPVEVRFASDVKKLSVRVVGNERILAPINQSWDSFFLGSSTVSDDFMTEREISTQAEREEL